MIWWTQMKQERFGSISAHPKRNGKAWVYVCNCVLTSLCPDESPDTGGGWSSSASVTGSYSSSSLNGSVSLVSHTISINTLNLINMSICTSNIYPHPTAQPSVFYPHPLSVSGAIRLPKMKMIKIFYVFLFFLYAFF